MLGCYWEEEDHNHQQASVKNRMVDHTRLNLIDHEAQVRVGVD